MSGASIEEKRRMRELTTTQGRKRWGLGGVVIVRARAMITASDGDGGNN